MLLSITTAEDLLKKKKKKKKTIQFYPQYYSKKNTAYFCLTLELVVLEMQNSADQLEEKIKTKTIKKRIYQLTRKLIYNVPNLLGGTSVDSPTVP